MDDLTWRVGRLEQQVRTWRLLTFSLLLGLAGVMSCRTPAAPTAPIALTAPGGARTVIEAGHIRLEDPSGIAIDLRVAAEQGVIDLVAPAGKSGAPQITLRVGGTGTPASLLLADRNARNFLNLYINGSAGIETAGVKEYKNVATP